MNTFACMNMDVAMCPPHTHTHTPACSGFQQQNNFTSTCLCFWNTFPQLKSHRSVEGGHVACSCKEIHFIYKCHIFGIKLKRNLGCVLKSRQLLSELQQHLIILRESRGLRMNTLHKSRPATETSDSLSFTVSSTELNRRKRFRSYLWGSKVGGKCILQPQSDGVREGWWENNNEPRDEHRRSLVSSSLLLSWCLFIFVPVFSFPSLCLPPSVLLSLFLLSPASLSVYFSWPSAPHLLSCFLSSSLLFFSLISFVYSSK